jgi:hypothetical protein
MDNEERDPRRLRQMRSQGLDTTKALSEFKPMQLPQLPGQPDWVRPGLATMARMAVYMPKVVLMGDTGEARLLVGPAKDVAEAIEAFSAGGEVRVETVRIADHMEALLYGSRLGVTELTPRRQIVDKDALTEWRWTIVGQAPGTQTAYLSFNEIKRTDEGILPRVIRSMQSAIFVQRGFLDRIVDFLALNWQWLWASIAVPFVGWLWANRKRLQRYLGGGSRS